MNNQRNLLLPIFALVGSLCYAAAGFADAYHDRQQWIFPAYKYCLIFGVIILALCFIMSLIWKTRTDVMIEKTTSFLIRRPVLAIVVSGLLWAVPIVLILDVMWETIWFMSILPALGIIVVFPLILTNKRIREKWLLSHFMLKWLILITIASAGSSLLFIILTNLDMLSGTDTTYFARPDRSHKDFYSPTHPYDSMIEIWDVYIFFVCEIFLALIIYGFGVVNRYLCKKLSAHRRAKRAIFNDLYIEGNDGDGEFDSTSHQKPVQDGEDGSCGD